MPTHLPSRQLPPGRLTQAYPHAYGPDSRNGVAFPLLPSLSLQARGGVPPLYLHTCVSLFLASCDAPLRIFWHASLRIPLLFNTHGERIPRESRRPMPQARVLYAMMLTSVDPAVSPEFPLPSPLLRTGGGSPGLLLPDQSHPSETTLPPVVGSLAIPTTSTRQVRHAYQDRLDSLLICSYSTRPARPGSIPCFISTALSPPIFTLAP